MTVWVVGGSEGRQIKGRAFRRRNVNHMAAWSYVWTWMLLSRGFPGRQLWVALHSGDTHSWSPARHVNRPYSGLEWGWLFTTTFSKEKNKLYHLERVPTHF